MYGYRVSRPFRLDDWTTHSTFDSPPWYHFKHILTHTHTHTHTHTRACTNTHTHTHTHGHTDAPTLAPTHSTHTRTITNARTHTHSHTHTHTHTHPHTHEQKETQYNSVNHTGQFAFKVHSLRLSLSSGSSHTRKEVGEHRQGFFRTADVWHLQHLQ